MKTFDVVIVGGGPAGVGAAKILKDNNINFCIIEKENFPREKLCGGGLTSKSTKILNNLKLKYDNIETVECNSIKLIAKNVDSILTLNSPIVMVDRMRFDYNNIKQVTDNNLYQEEKIISLDNNIIKTNKDEYKFQYLIFADGINGFSRRLIKNRKFGFCIEFDADKTYDTTIFDFCAINKGYGWIFPKKGKTTIGVGQMSKGTTDYFKALENFANKYGFTIDKKKIKGYHIPIFSMDVYNKSVINNNIIIVGDAASLVNQISGEGIYYALVSGKNAALSIIECMNSDKELKEVYFNKNESLINSLKKISKGNKLLYSKRGGFYIRFALRNKKILEKVKRVLG